MNLKLLKLTLLLSFSLTCVTLQFRVFLAATVAAILLSSTTNPPDPPAKESEDYP